MDNIFGQNRRSLRIRNFDYTSEGVYYVTQCVHNRRHIFGEIKNGKMHLSSIGEMVQNAWLGLPRYDPRVSLDEFIVMPNHIHGIIVIDSDGLESHRGRARGPAPTNSYHPLSLPDLLQRFKSWTTRQYLDISPPSAGRLWQRTFYDHVVRNDTDLRRIREYIRHNPANGETDPENGVNKTLPCASNT
jgi:REP element-mobilizing transposase RayT